MEQVKTAFALLLLGISLISPCSWAGVTGTTVLPPPPPPSVLHHEISFGQFKGGIIYHIERLSPLAKKIISALTDKGALSKFKDLFDGVYSELASNFLVSSHDKSKVNTSPEFYEEVGYYNDLSIPERLYEFFGKDLSLHPELKARADALFKELNRIDVLVRYKYFKTHNLLYLDGTLKPVAIRLLILERIVDAVDRGENPLSELEFGRPMIRASDLPEIFSEVEFASFGVKITDLPDINTKGKVIARFSEKNYYESSKGIFLPPNLSFRQCGDILSSVWFGTSLIQ